MYSSSRTSAIAKNLNSKPLFNTGLQNPAFVKALESRATRPAMAREVVDFFTKIEKSHSLDSAARKIKRTAFDSLALANGDWTMVGRS